MEIQLNTLGQLIKLSQEKDEKKQDFVAEIRNIEFRGREMYFAKLNRTGQRDEVGFNGYIRKAPIQNALWNNYGMNENAEAQWLDKLGQAVYGRTLPKALFKTLSGEGYGKIMNVLIHERKATRTEPTWMFRTNGENIRAILGSEYPRTWNTEILMMTQGILEKMNTDYHLTRPVVTGDEMIVRTVVDGIERDGFRIGFLLRNNEVGMGKLELIPAILRTACDNSFSLRTEEALQLTHNRAFTSHSLATLIAGAIPGMIVKANEMVEQYCTIEDIVVPDFRQVLRGLQNELHIPEGRMETVEQGSEGKRTVGGLVNAMTWYAKEFYGGSKEALQIEQLAGETLYNHDKVTALLRQRSTAKVELDGQLEAV